MMNKIILALIFTILIALPVRSQSLQENSENAENIEKTFMVLNKSLSCMAIYSYLYKTMMIMAAIEKVLDYPPQVIEKQIGDSKEYIKSLRNMNQLVLLSTKAALESGVESEKVKFFIAKTTENSIKELNKEFGKVQDIDSAMNFVGKLATTDQQCDQLIDAAMNGGKNSL